jgi:hypothetical protein
MDNWQKGFYEGSAMGVFAYLKQEGHLNKDAKLADIDPFLIEQWQSMAYINMTAELRQDAVPGKKTQSSQPCSCKTCTTKDDERRYFNVNGHVVCGTCAKRQKLI